MSRRSRRRQIYRDLVYRGVNVLARAVFSLGLERSIRFADRLGPLASKIQRRERRVALENLERCLGNALDGEEREAVANRVFANFALSSVETMWLSRWDRLSEWLTFEYDGRHHLDHALSHGRGVICINGHFGNWEAMCAAVARDGYPSNVVVRRMKDPRLDEWFREIRDTCGVHVIQRGKSPMEFVKTLRKGELLGLMIDLDTNSGRGVFVDFFGRPAYTQIGPFALARRLGCPLLPSLCFREGLNRLRLHFGEPWFVEETGNQEEDIRRAAQRATKYLEDRIRERPEQWAWFHKRWKTTPDRVRKP